MWCVGCSNVAIIHAPLPTKRNCLWPCWVKIEQFDRASVILFGPYKLWRTTSGARLLWGWSCLPRARSRGTDRAETGGAHHWVLKRREFPGFVILIEITPHPWDTHYQFSIKNSIRKPHTPGTSTDWKPQPGRVKIMLFTRDRVKILPTWPCWPAQAPDLCQLDLHLLPPKYREAHTHLTDCEHQNDRFAMTETEKNGLWI